VSHELHARVTNTISTFAASICCCTAILNTVHTSTHYIWESRNIHVRITRKRTCICCWTIVLNPLYTSTNYIRESRTTRESHEQHMYLSCVDLLLNHHVESSPYIHELYTWVIKYIRESRTTYIPLLRRFAAEQPCWIFSIHPRTIYVSYKIYTRVTNYIYVDLLLNHHVESSPYIHELYTWVIKYMRESRTTSVPLLRRFAAGPPCYILAINP